MENKKDIKIVSEEDIKVLLSKMTNFSVVNMIQIIKLFGSLKYIDEEKQTILHILVDNKYKEEECFLAIKVLLQSGISPNAEAFWKYNFIQTALYAGYSEEFILKIIKESLKYNLNVNHVDGDNDTIVHTAIYSDDYLGGVERIFDLLYSNGYDCTKVCKEGRNLLEAMIFQGTYSEEQIESFKKKLERVFPEIQKRNEVEEENKSTNVVQKEVNVSETKLALSSNDIFELEKFGRILNMKNYEFEPAVGMENELKNLMIVLAQDKKNPLIVGESGVGKTAIVEELVYKIKTGQVPSFLQDKIILEISPSDVVTRCEYVEMFGDNMTELMKLCEKLNIIIFIDGIHTIYGIDTTKVNNMLLILKYYIDRTDLKVIGTITEKEYQKFFNDNDLKRNFEKITVKEPTEDVLCQVVDKTLENYCIKSGIFFEDANTRSQILNTLLNVTAKSNRTCNDMVNNPNLVKSIIDKAFAFAKVYNSEFITVEHFIESLECCDIIYDYIKDLAIKELKKLDTSISSPIQRVLK